eukprot:3748485-Lingulodinium_polyedra.AAC.1
MARHSDVCSSAPRALCDGQASVPPLCIALWCSRRTATDRRVEGHGKDERDADAVGVHGIARL